MAFAQSCRRRLPEAGAQSTSLRDSATAEPGTLLARARQRWRNARARGPVTRRSDARRPHQRRHRRRQAPAPTPAGGSVRVEQRPGDRRLHRARSIPSSRAGRVARPAAGANMEFLRDRIIEAGKCGGMDLGWNLKRGGPDISIDFLAWRRSDGEMGVDLGPRLRQHRHHAAALLGRSGARRDIHAVRRRSRTVSSSESVMGAD